MTGHLISLNGEYLYSAAHGGMYAPLRINDNVVNKVQKAIASNTPTETSCLQTLTATWRDGKFMLTASFQPTTKCTTDLISAPSHQTKTEMCFKCLCNGKCSDEYMCNVVAKNILPELYNTKQK